MREIRKVGTFEGHDVIEATLVSKTGVRISVMNYGAVIRDWQVPVAGKMRSVVLGFDQFEYYPIHSPHFGAIAGRVANRIGKARFSLDGQNYVLPANEGPNHLHGGPRGFSRRLWNMQVLPSGDGLLFSLTSPDGDMGYPGRLDVALTYQLIDNRLRMDFAAETDVPTPVNLVQHNYFNLMDEGDVRAHKLQVNANQFTELDEALIPTGEIRTVKNTMLDFREERLLGDGAGEPLAIDKSLVLDSERDVSAPVATLAAPDDSLKLTLKTDRPCLQVYTGGKLDIPVAGLDGRHYPRFGGICLEDQDFPDAVNHPNFPSTIITPDRPYRHWCEIEIE